VNGFQDAVLDANQLESWWTRWPEANVGIQTGEEVGLVVLDIDPDKDGAQSLEALIHANGELPETWQVRTGAGGSHYYFAYPGESVSNRVRVRPGIDVRGQGGYVVAPPSLHASGERYEWVVHPTEVDLAYMPTWLLEVITHEPVRDHGGVHTNGRVPEGQRNSTLASLAGTMRRKGMSATAIEAALRVYNVEQCSPPLSDSEVVRIAGSISRYEPEASDGRDAATGQPLTDSGNAERYVLMWGKEFRYCHPWKHALLWDGRRWKIEDRAETLERTKRVARAIYSEASEIADDDVRKKSVAWALKSERADRRQAMLRLAFAETGVAVSPAELDRHRLLLNLENGTLDLETMELHAHDRGQLLTQASDVPYDPSAECPTFDAFLSLVVPDDEVRAFLQRAVGYSLSGRVDEQVLFFLYGDGANGKTTLLTTLQTLLGEDYVLEAPPDLLLSKRGSHPTEEAALFGKRLVVCQESGLGRRLDEARVKRLTGGDRITARRMREDYWSFDPTHKIWLSSNYQPTILGTDEGMWRRVLLVPFTTFIPEDGRDRDLLRKLAAEQPGILAWCVRGWQEYQSVGLKPPAAVKAATGRYRAEQDVLGRFLEENVQRQKGKTIRAQAVYDRYRSWCETNGEDSMTQTLFGRLLGQRGYEKRTSGTTVYLDVRLVTGQRSEGSDGS
jgi:putative DNA primase/helicase